MRTFFDDTCIYAKTWDLSKGAKLTLNLKKCQFEMKNVEYLGYVLGEGVIQPGDRKILVFENFPTPQNKHEVRRFMGLASFFRRFVPNFAKIATPITNLLENEEPFIWSEDQELAFIKLKEILTAKPVLKLYNPKAAITELHTDAS